MKNIKKFLIFSLVFANFSFFSLFIPQVNADDSQSSPVITSISPISGETPVSNPIGTKVTIYGKNLGDDCRARSGRGCLLFVYFGNGTVNFQTDITGATWTDTKIEVEVPTSATTANIRVARSETENYGDSNAKVISTYDIIGPVFTVTNADDSQSSTVITSISPTSGLTDTEVTIVGQGFKDPCTGKGTLECQAVVFFGDAAVNFVNDISYHISWADNKIVTRVPNHATTGIVRVYRNEIFNWGEEGSYNETFDVSGPVFTVTNSAKKVDPHLEAIKKTTEYISDSKYDMLLQEINSLRNQVKEQEAEIKYLKSLTSEVKNISESMKSFMTNFVTYGVDENTKKLGEGERAAVLNSFKEAYGKLPETNVEVEDAIKIANGRFPSLRNESVEEEAEKIFRHVYGRKPDAEKAEDQNFTMVVSYGLRQKAENRKLETEKKALDIYKGIYKQLPQNTEDWNILQGIAYSGAKK